MALINDNDMKVIMKANQEEVKRKMLNDRLQSLYSLSQFVSTTDEVIE